MIFNPEGVEASGVDGERSRPGCCSTRPRVEPCTALPDSTSASPHVDARAPRKALLLQKTTTSRIPGKSLELGKAAPSSNLPQKPLPLGVKGAAGASGSS